MGLWTSVSGNGARLARTGLAVQFWPPKSRTGVSAPIYPCSGPGQGSLGRGLALVCRSDVSDRGMYFRAMLMNLISVDVSEYGLQT